MKKIFLMLVFIASACFMAAQAMAAQSDTVAVKVTITPSISVSITESELSLGSVDAGGTKVSAAAVTVKNDGSGINETYSLSLTSPSGWTASQTAAGVETYVLNTAFSALASGITWDMANHALSTTPVASSSAKFAGDQTGANVPYNATRTLWFEFKAPTATSISAEQGIAVTVTASAS